MGYYSGPRIITNGLVLHLDAANPKSYPGSGNTWFDLSGNGNHGTLTNGPTYSANNNGSIVFDGVNDYVTTQSVALNLSAGFSLASLFRSTNLATVQQGILSYNAGFPDFYFNLWCPGTAQLRLETKVTSSPSVGIQIVSGNLSNNTWYYAVGTYNNGVSNLYINGRLVSTGSFTPTSLSTLSAPIVIGSYAGYLSGSVAISSIYNRALSADEITQNFNATRSRYGL